MKEQIQKLTLEEKAALLQGKTVWTTYNFPHADIPEIFLADGPHGLRKQAGSADHLGLNESIPATCFPTAAGMANSWNPELAEELGRALGEEAAANDVHVVLGPGLNIKRSPLCGRNFEYFSEDPYLAGKMAAAYVRGIQANGVAACPKHFAVNSQELRRMSMNSVLDERTMREIYLTGFEIAVKEGRAKTIMSSYNMVNGTYANENEHLLKDILRREWGFDGFVVTDWGALYNRIDAYKAGCDLNMPGGSKYMEKATLKAVKSGELDESLIDRAVERILRLVKRGREIQPYKVDFDAHHSLAKEIATEGAVLMKNEDNILPLDESDTVIIGYMAEHIRYQGSGSSHINPTKLTNVIAAMPDALYFSCADAHGNVSHEEIERAAKMAKERMVTRTVETKEIEVMTVNTESATIENIVVRLSRTYKTDDELFKAVSLNVNTDTIKAVKVVTAWTETKLYGMSESDFLKYAVELDPETRKELSTTDEDQDEAQDEN